MLRAVCSTALFTVPIMLAGCGGPEVPTQPLSTTASVSSTGALSNDKKNDRKVKDNVVRILDRCDGPTFNANPPAGVGPGTCSRKHGITFAHFIAELTKHMKVGPWRFEPDKVHARVGETLTAWNKGGETHTFTEVKAFGGGINATLNSLSGNPTEADECKNLAPGDFIAPGTKKGIETLDDEGTELYQCCIHPWMRATVIVKKK
jgi:plastocyanin